MKLAGECRRPEPATKRIHEHVYYHLEVLLLRVVWLGPPQGFAISPCCRPVGDAASAKAGRDLGISTWRILVSFLSFRVCKRQRVATVRKEKVCKEVCRELKPAFLVASYKKQSAAGLEGHAETPVSMWLVPGSSCDKQ